MPSARSDWPEPADTYTLQPVWEVWSKHKEYLGVVRREERSGTSVYIPERKDGNPIELPRRGSRPGWSSKNSAAAALVLSYR